MEKKNDELNEKISFFISKEKKNSIEIKGILQDLNEALNEKTRRLEILIRQIEGDSESDNNDTNETLALKKVDANINAGLGKKKMFPCQDGIVAETNARKSLKDMFINVNYSSKVMSDQIDKLQYKVDSQSNELFNRLKKDLTGTFQK